MSLRKRSWVLMLSAVTGLILFGTSEFSYGARSFSQCRATDPARTELDTFCPRMEGIHLEGCCPPIFRSPPLQCRYAIYEQSGQPYLANATRTVCRDGVNETVKCCIARSRSCYRDPVTLSFLPRLLHRNQNCCFENCPAASYWTAPPTNPNISASHRLIDGSPSMCSGTVLDECEDGDSANCPANSPCPPPPSTATPIPPGGGGSVTPVGGSSPVPSPGPASSSTPAPPPNIPGDGA